MGPSVWPPKEPHSSRQSLNDEPIIKALFKAQIGTVFKRAPMGQSAIQALGQMRCYPMLGFSIDSRTLYCTNLVLP